MKRVRVIPVLLLAENGMVKTQRFSKPCYLGDPINAVKIFNDKEVDELAILDISATPEQKPPDMNMIAEIAGEAFMPLSYGGGISSVDQVRKILYSGIEKIVLNKSAHTRPELIHEIANSFGSQSVMVSIDVKKNIFGRYKVFTDNGAQNTGLNPIEFAKQCESRGAGEILLNSIERDGTYNGYDLELVKSISRSVNIPVVACGGAGSLEDFRAAVTEGNASAVSAGSMFIFQRPHNAVLISYPKQSELVEKVYQYL